MYKYSISMSHSLKLIIISFIFLFALNINGQSVAVENPLNNDFWSQTDKQKHMIATMGVSTATYTFLEFHPTYKNFSTFKKRMISFSSAMLVGLVKETIDSTSKNNQFSSGDMFANLSGAFAFQLSVSIPINLKKKEDPYLLAAK